MKKGELYSIHKQIVNWKNEGNALAFLIKGRINDFYKDHGVIVDKVIEDTRKLRDEYLTVDENGKIVFDEKKSPVYKEGKTEYSFNKNWETLMQQAATAKFNIEEYELPEPVTAD